MSYELRLLEERDIAQVEEIEREAYRTPWSAFAFEEELKDNGMAYYVVMCPEDDRTIVGYGGFWQVLDEGHITKVTIAEGYRGQGLSKELLMGMLKLMKSMGIKRSTLEVRVSNQAAIGLYEKMGFERSGIRPRYYADREDALIMWRELEDVAVSEDE